MAKYINDERLTDNIIEDVINRCGLELVTSAVDDHTGQVVFVEPIERMQDMIMVRCKNIETAEFAELIYSKYPMLGMFNTNAYSIGDEVVMLEDFIASRFKSFRSVDDCMYSYYRSVWSVSHNRF